MEKLWKLEWCTISTYHSGTILQNFLISFALFGGHALHIAYICIKGFWRSSLLIYILYNFEGVKNYFTYWNYNQRNVDISRVFFQNILYVQFFFWNFNIISYGKGASKHTLMNSICVSRASQTNFSLNLFC